jgi:cysteine-rich repeat protein
METIDPGSLTITPLSPSGTFPYSPRAMTYDPSAMSFLLGQSFYVDLFAVTPAGVSTDSGVDLDHISTGLAIDEVGVCGAACGDSVVQPGEDCDDGNTSNGDCCDENCQYEAPASSCDDGDACTTGDTCDGAGDCESGDPTICPACETCDSGLGCVVGPVASGCKAAGSGKSLLQLKNKDNDNGDKVMFKWLKGAEVLSSELGAPLTADDYTLCVFDESGVTPTLLFRGAAPAGGTCGTNPCWKGIGTPPGDKGFKYKDPEGTPQGMTGVIVKPNGAGKAKAVVKGKGTNLLLPGENAHPPLPLPTPFAVRAQLQSENGLCLEATFSGTGVIANGDQQFKGKSD